MRFDWQNNLQLEDVNQRNHATKDFQHPTNPNERIKIQHGKVIHYFDGVKFQDIPDLPFPEGKDILAPQLRHFIMDLPLWGREELSPDGKTLRIYDKKDQSIYIFKDPFVAGKGQNPYTITTNEFGEVKKTIKEAGVDFGAFEIENHKMYVRLPDILKNPYGLQVYDLTDTGSTNNKDAMIQQGDPITNFGSDVIMRVARWVGNSQRTVMDWTLSSGSGTISKIALFVKVLGGTGGIIEDVNLHELTQVFTEAGVTWNKYDGTTNWTTAGGDYSATIVDEVSIDFTEPIAATYREWDLVGGGSTNPIAGLTWGSTVDLLLKIAGEVDSHYATLHSKEAVGTADDPYLEITYTGGAGATGFMSLNKYW